MFEDDYENDNIGSNQSADRFDNLLDASFNTASVKAMLNEQIAEIAEANDWNGEDYSEFKNEQTWYDEEGDNLGYPAEQNVLERMISDILSEMNVNINRLEGDLYELYEGIIKDQYPFLDIDPVD